MKEQLKASVLAKIGGMSYEEELENGWEYERRHYDGRSWHRLHKGCITYDFDHWDADDDPVWDLAADILGIKPKEERPSDALLRECWKEASVCIIEGEFEAWLATLPPNPLKADREIVAKYLPYLDLIDATARGKANDCVEDADKLEAALQRLAGMEASK